MGSGLETCVLDSCEAWDGPCVKYSHLMICTSLKQLLRTFSRVIRNLPFKCFRNNFICRERLDIKKNILTKD